MLRDDKSLGIPVRERSKKDAVDDAEDGRVCADAESERENGDSGEARAALQHAERVTKIACDLVQPANNVHFASIFLEQGGIAETPFRFIARLLVRHSSSDVVCGAHFEVRAHLFVEVVVQAFSPQHASQAGD